MALTIRSYKADNDISFIGLLPKLRPGNGPVDVSIYIPYMRRVYEQKIIDNLNIEFKRRGIRHLNFIFRDKNCLNLLNCFFEVGPETFNFAMDFGANVLNDAKSLFEQMKKIKPRSFGFKMYLRSSSEDFVADMSEEIQTLEAKLDKFNVYIYDAKYIKISRLESRKVLDNLSSFECISFEMQSIRCPIYFGYKLGFLSVRKLEVLIKACEMNIAFHLLFKRMKSSLLLQIRNIRKVGGLLPLFMPTSKTLKVTLKISTQKINKCELKAILKYKQLFVNIADIQAYNSVLPLSKSEIAFLTKYNKLRGNNT